MTQQPLYGHHNPHPLSQMRTGKVDLIYIDPPFDVGADFSMSVAIFQ